MPFTTGSVELAKANKLGNQLAHLFAAHGLSGAIGRTGAQMVERQARKLGFGITGLTTGGSFPPFGTIYPGLLPNNAASSLEAALQNPRGSTLPSGNIVGACEGQTVGIFLKKFVRNGADYRAIMYYGISLGGTLGPGATGCTAWGIVGGVTLDTGDRINFGGAFGNDDYAIVASPRGFTLASGATRQITFASPWAGATKATGTLLTVETIGVNAFTGVAGPTGGQSNNTNAVYGTTFAFGPASASNGYTATIYFNSPTSGSTWSVN